MKRLLDAARWLHDPAIAGHPRYRAMERRQILVAVRAGAISIAAVQIADAVLVGPGAPALLVVNLPVAIVSIALFAVLQAGRGARKRPVVAAFLLGLLGLAASLLPIVLVPSIAPMMAAYIPILIVAAALFVPWTIAWHVPWLLVTVAGIAAFAASPLAQALTPAGRQELVSITVSAALVSFVGHTILQRERRRMFGQRMQLRGVNQTVRRQRRELEALAAQLESVARRDPLTGIGNRLRLDEDVAALRRAVGGSVETTGSAAILVDIDHFKDYNDRHGHLAGDEVLREVARTIAINVRPQDRVYRFGGEEFLILLEATDPDGAALVAERLRRAVQALEIPNRDNPPWNVVTVSAGVAALGLADGKSDRWIREADERLYTSKRAGRNRITAPTPADGSSAAEPAA